MSGTKITLSVLLLALLGLGAARGQENYTASVGISNPLSVDAGMDMPPPYTLGPPLGPSTWLTFCKPEGCCGPLGKCGPIGTEVYVRAGTELPFGAGYFSRNLDPGWTIQGGGRVLFFDPAEVAAWTVDANIVTTHNLDDHKDEPVTLLHVPVKVINPLTGQTITPNLPQIIVHPHALHRTAVGLGVGREWYLLGNADIRNNDLTWRVGVDLGGRWGEGSVDYLEFRRTTGRYGQFYTAVHSDVEVPCGTCIFFGGLRVEYSYMWSSFLQPQNDTDLSEFGIMLTAGIRF
jgi:hypothetical protein